MSSQVVPQGYKQTKIGVIPEDWEVARINEVTTYVDYRGKTPKKINNGILLITARNIKYGYLDYETSREYIAEDDYQNVMSRGVPEIGDILLTTEAPLGNIAQIDNENIALAQRVIKFRGKEKLDNTYLKYHFLSEKFQAYLLRLAIGTTVLGIQGKQLHKMLIPLPPLKEQEKIADILTTWDSAILKQEKLIKQKEILKKGLMQKLLSGEVRFDGFNDEWEIKRIKDIFEITRGNVLAVKMMKNEISKEYKYPVFSSQTKKNGLTGYYTEYLFEDCITWTTDGANAGDVNIRQGKFYCTNVCGVLKNKEGYVNQCVSEMLNLITHKYVSYVGNPKLMNNTMGIIKIKLPKLIEEQQKIAEVLTNADKEIDLLKNELEELKEQKKGLMQKLLTGEVRVKV